jgi:hypothetical protein
MTFAFLHREKHECDTRSPNESIHSPSCRPILELIIAMVPIRCAAIGWQLPRIG